MGNKAFKKKDAQLEEYFKVIQEKQVNHLRQSGYFHNSGEWIATMREDLLGSHGGWRTELIDFLDNWDVERDINVKASLVMLDYLDNQDSSPKKSTRCYLKSINTYTTFQDELDENQYKKLIHTQLCDSKQANVLNQIIELFQRSILEEFTYVTNTQRELKQAVLEEPTQYANILNEDLFDFLEIFTKAVKSFYLGFKNFITEKGAIEKIVRDAVIRDELFSVVIEFNSIIFNHDEEKYLQNLHELSQETPIDSSHFALDNGAGYLNSFSALLEVTSAKSYCQVLDCLINTSYYVTKALDDYYPNANIVLETDVILQIFQLLILRSCVPKFPILLKTIETLLDDSNQIGMLGFLLTTWIGSVEALKH